MLNFPLGKAVFHTLAVVAGLASAVLVGSNRAQAQDFQFVSGIDFTPRGMAQLAGAGKGTLTVQLTDKLFRLRLTNVAGSGATGASQLLTEVSRADLQLDSSGVYDTVSGNPLRLMKRRTGESMLGGKADIFEFREYKGNNVTTTEPHIEFKVVDFVSVMLVAADAIARKAEKETDYSMLYDRSVRRVRMTFTGTAQVDGRPATQIRVAAPDNPASAITYLIATTKDGKYYPALISVPTQQGVVELEGRPR